MSSIRLKALLRTPSGYSDRFKIYLIASVILECNHYLLNGKSNLLVPDFSDAINEVDWGFYFDSADRMLSTWRCFHWTTFPCRLGQTPGWTQSYVEAALNLLFSVLSVSVASEQTVTLTSRTSFGTTSSTAIKGEDNFSLTD